MRAKVKLHLISNGREASSQKECIALRLRDLQSIGQLQNYIPVSRSPGPAFLPSEDRLPTHACATRELGI
jgi:hypothetical protein